MKILEKINKCLQALTNVNNWDMRVCPFCGKAQHDKHGYPENNHEDDCPVKLAMELEDDIP